MSFSDMSRQADTPRTATTVRMLRWKQTSGAAIFHFFGDIMPALIGIGRWLLSGSLTEVLIWGGIAWLAGSYLIVPILTDIYLVGPSEDEFREILDLFEKNADNESTIQMAMGQRRFDLYCEVTPDEADYIGIKLPRKYWDDLLDDETKRELRSAGAKEIEEAGRNIYLFWPRKNDNARSIVEYLFTITNSSLEQFAISPLVAVGRRCVFTDEPDKPLFPNRGIKKK